MPRLGFPEAVGQCSLGESGFAGTCIAVADMFPQDLLVLLVAARGPFKQCQNTTGTKRKGSYSDQGKTVTNLETEMDHFEINLLLSPVAL